jgi:protein-S-isoprenylcysteine O-methyltransferase Ste14
MAAETPLVIRIPPPVWLFGMLAGAFLLHWLLAPPALLRSTLAGVVLGASGFALANWGSVLFSKAGTEILPSSPANRALVVSGPFRYSRNPMYVGVVLLTLGFAIGFGTWPFYAVPVLMFLLLNFAFIPFEEAKMQRQFCDQYTDYRRRVRRWL